MVILRKLRIKVDKTEVIAAGAAVVFLGASIVASDILRTALPWRLNNALVCGLQMTAVALIATVTWLIMVVIVHIRAAISLREFLLRPLELNVRPVVRTLGHFCLYMTGLAFCAVGIGIIL